MIHDKNHLIMLNLFIGNIMNNTEKMHSASHDAIFKSLKDQNGFAWLGA